MSESEEQTLLVGDRTLSLRTDRRLDTLGIDAVRAGEEPLYAVIWPSARALATELATLDLTGRRVLELGCGLGAVGLAAAVRGASVVLADIDPRAVALAEENARRNGLRVEARVLDWASPPDDLGVFDGVLGADILYDDGMLRGVLRFLRGHLAPDGIAWIADPMRVSAAGVRGAGVLSGLTVEGRVLAPGSTSAVGGVQLLQLRPRSR